MTSSPADPSRCESYPGCKNGAAVAFCGHRGLGRHVVPVFAARASRDFFAKIAE